MSACTVIITADRSFRYQAARRQSHIFERQVADALGTFDLPEAAAIAARYRRSHTAKVVGSGLSSFQASLPILAEAEVIYTTQRAMRRSASLAHEEMKCDLAVLASIASTAPLFGAFGTVLDLFRALGGAAMERGTYIAATAGGVAEALSLTAWGLLLGTVAMWCHKYLSTELAGLDREMKNQFIELVNFIALELERPKRPGQPDQASAGAE